MSPISEVPFTTIGVIKPKIMNKENNNNEITLKYLLNTITSPSRPFLQLTIFIALLVQLNCALVEQE